MGAPEDAEPHPPRVVMIYLAALFIGLLLLSGFFAASQIALFSLPRARVESLLEEERRGAEALRVLRENPDRLFVTILIGSTVTNVSAAVVATLIGLRAWGAPGIAVAIGAATLLVLFLGEIVPRSYAAGNAARMSLIAAPALRLISRILFFLVLPLEKLTSALLPRHPRGAVPGVTEREIRNLTRMGHVAGAIEEHERRLIERAFLLDTTRAWEVMTPRVDIFAWPESMTLAEVRDDLPVPYSRIPVYGESLDEISGVLYLRDVYHALIDGRAQVTLGELARQAFSVPATVPLIQLLEEFQARRMHLGVVVDEHGGIDGIVTLEDLLEELVGEIVDEVDIPEETLVRVNREEVLADGSTDLREINQFFETSFPLAEHRTLNGYLLEELGHVPRPHEVIDREDVRIEVLRASETQVTRARLSRRSRTSADGTGGSGDIESDPGTERSEPGARPPTG